MNDDAMRIVLIDDDWDDIEVALRARDDRMRGTFVASYGPASDPQSGALIKRLSLDRARPTTASG